VDQFPVLGSLACARAIAVCRPLTSRIVGAESRRGEGLGFLAARGTRPEVTDLSVVWMDPPTGTCGTSPSWVCFVVPPLPMAPDREQAPPALFC